jgi:Trypsin-like peptidase domain/Effector-associated domain 1
VRTAVFNSLQFKSGSRLELLVNMNQPHRDVVSELISVAFRAGWLDELLEAAYRENPSNPRIAQLAESTGLAAKVDLQRSGVSDPSFSREITPRALEQVVGQRDLSLDAGLWIERFAKISGQVCRVEVGNDVALHAMSTGFLVGPDVLLAPYHLLEPVIRNAMPPQVVRLRFDFKVLSDGTRTNGITVGLQPCNWLIDSTDTNVPGALPLPDELDFALVRLDQQIGLEPVSPIVGGSTLRGWVRVPDVAPKLRPRTAVFIVHYPLGSALQVSVDPEGIVGPNANQIRVLYLITTSAGSAGAPCFDANWNLFGMHQARRAIEERGDDLKQGISISAIRNRLGRVGKLSALGGPPP